MPSTDYHQCKCASCAKHPDGYKYQTKDLIRKHAKRYGNLENKSIGGVYPIQGQPDLRRPLADLPINYSPRICTRTSIDPSVAIRTTTAEDERVLAEDEDDWWSDDGEVVEDTVEVDRTGLGAVDERGNSEEREVVFEDGADDWWLDDEVFEGEAGENALPFGVMDVAGAIQEPIEDAAEEQQTPANVSRSPSPIRQGQDVHWRPIGNIDVRIPGSDVNEADKPDTIPRAYLEQSCVRIAYLQATIANVYSHVSVLRSTEILNGTLDALLAAGALPELPRPVRTLESAKRHLGIDADQYITQYNICPQCWKHYTPREITDLDGPACLVEDCDGILYDESIDGKGRRKRQPRKVNPYTSIIQTLRRFFLRPGFARIIRDNRRQHGGLQDDDDFVMRDIYDGAGWEQCYVKTVREIGNLGSVRDVSQEGGEPQRLTDQRFGLHLTLNTDWFQLLSNRPHSTGPVYITIDDLPRDQRFLQVNTMCPCVMPGPGEPNAQQLNHVLEPAVKEMIILKGGIQINVHDEDELQDIYADCMFINCDTPAARKVSGTAGHSADFNPCPYCDFVLIDLDKPQMFRENACRKKDDSFLLKQAFISRDATSPRQNQILKDYGIRWSVMNMMPDWKPSSKTALDFMHNIFLGLILHFFMTVLFAAHMFSGRGGSTSSKQRFEDFINDFRWPSHITRLPKNLGEHQSLKKADEWRRLLTIAPVLLWFAWRNGDDTIPNSAPPVSPNENINTNHSRNRRKLYEAALLLAAGVRLLSTRTITLRQARLGQDFLLQFCRALLTLGVSLVINHHLCTHFYEMIRIFGPIYAWWLFAFERFNGMMEKVKHNGHDGGQMEVTLLRNWVQTQLIYELLISLPANAHERERAMLNQIVESEARQRGSMMSQIAIFQSEVDTDHVKLPKRIKKAPINLIQHDPSGNLYRLFLSYCQSLWPDLNLVPQFSPVEGRSFVPNNVARPVPYIRKDGIRYGCMENKRTKADSVVFISQSEQSDIREAAEILAYYVVCIPDTDKSPHVCAVVRRLFSDEQLPHLPWDLYSSILGIQVSHADRFHPPEIIPVSRISAPLGIAKIFLNSIQSEVWVAISFDHVGAEPEDFDDNFD
ncbi:hypothetical protein CVT26_012594 [Gymnopilus dilepis]|uniref:Transposase family Tnp2 protein n=1 Tax=Gymnopilus dilepis TaxID=231916 RepID=A0A409WMQ0_9AGAR|nr:hypothetical protein CVT26_012594 [Gymnopilus dilepis]